MNQFGYGSSPMTTGATNPQWVRQQIGQDLGYSQMSNRSAGFGTSTFGQFSTNPQMVRQQISQDIGQSQFNQRGGLGQTSGMMSANMQGGYQPMQNQGYYNQAVLQQVMNSVQTNPQQIRQQIQQDIRYGQQPPAFISQQQYGGLSQQGTMQQGLTRQGGTLSQFATNPQVVQQHIQQDLNQGYGNTYNQGFAGRQTMQQQGMMNQGGTLSQFATNPQTVQQHIREDLSQQSQYGNWQSGQQQAGLGWGSQAYYS